jgi:hypothetical protein
MSVPDNWYSPLTGQLFHKTERLDLTMRRNDNPWRRRFPVLTHPITYDGADGHEHEEQALIDTTGWSMRMQIRLYEGAAGDPIVGLDLATYTTHSDGTPFADGAPYSVGLSANGSGMEPGVGYVDVFVRLGDLALLPRGPVGEGPMMFAYDLMLQPPGGDENAWYTGLVMLHEGVTKYALLS